MIELYRDAALIGLITVGAVGVCGIYRFYRRCIRALEMMERNDKAVDDLYGHHNRLQKQVETIADRKGIHI